MNEREASLILGEYHRLRPGYDLFGRSLKHLVTSVLKPEALGLHSVTFRTKDPDSLRGKLLRPEKSYTRLADVTDLLGLRVITYFENDVDRVVEILRSELNISEAHSVDKRKLQDATSFGYASVHLVCQLSEERSRLAEYRPFAGMYCEIQVRSILQHTWAEIEHDLGYKAERAVPVPIKRRFSMLAGLFALADQEFVRLRDDLSGYSNRVKEELITSPSSVLIDLVSLSAFTESNPLSLQLDQTALDAARAIAQSPDADWTDRLLAQLEHFRIHTIEDLHQALIDNQEAIQRLLRNTFAPGKHTTLARGIGCYYLPKVLLGRLPTKAETLAGIQKFYKLSAREATSVADKYREAVGQG